jgi:3-oxoisoapionate decarboxylase
MRLGISSWTYPWALGVNGFVPPQPLTLAELFIRASALKVRVVQLADNVPLHKLDPSELRDARDQAASLGLAIEIGTRGVEPAHLLSYLNIALEFHAPLLRTLLDIQGPEASMEQAEKWIRGALPEFESAGVILGIENYERHSCRDLAALVNRLDTQWVGVCLDTVNSLGALETPERVMETLAPLAVNLHVKDFSIERVPHRMGFVVSGACAGEGKLDIPCLLAQMNQRNPHMSAILEQWPPLMESVEATVRMEREWAERGVRYLRSCGCT